MNIFGKILVSIGMSLLTEVVAKKLLAALLEDAKRWIEGKNDDKYFDIVIEALRK